MPENIGENPLPSEKMEPTLEPVLEGEVLNLETGTEKEGEKTRSSRVRRSSQNPYRNYGSFTFSIPRTF